MYRYIKNIAYTLLHWIFPPRHTERAIFSLTESEVALFPPASPIEHTETYALFSYKDPRVTALIWEIKYHHNTHAIHLIAPLLADLIISEYTEKNLFTKWDTCLLVPVPSSTQKLKKRGYSHTHEICTAVAHLLPASIIYRPDILKKPKDTLEQNKLPDRALRLKNLHGSQEVVDTLPPHTCVFLVDDVTTTGATLKESRRALALAGVKDVYAFTIAH